MKSEFALLLTMLFATVCWGQSGTTLFSGIKEADTSVSNATALQVHLLYEQHTFRGERFLRLGPALLYGAQVCKAGQHIALFYGNEAIELHKDGVTLHKSPKFLCEEPVESPIFGTNRKYEDTPDGDMIISYLIEDKVLPTSLGELTVHIRQLKCDDTGTNPITLVHQGKSLQIKSIDSLQFFESDIDEDGENELYILSFAMCTNRLKIYRIKR